MAEYQIGSNLYADTQGKYYNYTNGAKSYVESPYDGMSSKINSLYDTQQKTQLEQLKAQRDKAVAGFNQQKKELAPVYQNQRNQADVVNAQNVARLRELMAANGINASGENLTTQAAMASSRQSALGEITSQENQAMGAIDRQISDVNDPSKEREIQNAIEMERSRALLDAYNQAQADIMRMYQDWRAEQERQRAAAARASSSRKSSSSGTTTTASVPQNMQQDMEAYYKKLYEEAMAPSPRLSITPGGYGVGNGSYRPVF